MSRTLPLSVVWVIRSDSGLGNSGRRSSMQRVRLVRGRGAGTLQMCWRGRCSRRARRGSWTRSQAHITGFRRGCPTAHAPRRGVEGQLDNSFDIKKDFCFRRGHHPYFSRERRLVVGIGAATRLRAVDRSGHGEYLATLLTGVSGGGQGAAASRRLEHQNALIERPLISRFRRIKCRAIGGVPGGNSLSRAPRA